MAVVPAAAGLVKCSPISRIIRLVTFTPPALLSISDITVSRKSVFGFEKKKGVRTRRRPGYV